MAGSNFLIHLSGGWLTGSALAKLMSRVHSVMHYSSSKHYFGGVYAPSHVNALRRSSRFGSGGGDTPLNRWTSGVFFLPQHSMKMPNGDFRCDLKASETAKAEPSFTSRRLLLGNTQAAVIFSEHLCRADQWNRPIKHDSLSSFRLCGFCLPVASQRSHLASIFQQM